jgi:hypothetical protein
MYIRLQPGDANWDWQQGLGQRLGRTLAVNAGWVGLPFRGGKDLNYRTTRGGIGRGVQGAVLVEDGALAAPGAIRREYTLSQGSLDRWDSGILELPHKL